MKKIILILMLFLSVGFFQSGKAQGNLFMWHNSDIPEIVREYGYIYNQYAIQDSRNIAPNGWHVPTQAEWLALRTYAGGGTVAGGKLKETGTVHWISPNTCATNDYGFNSRGSGHRAGTDGTFNDLNNSCTYWSSTNYTSYDINYSGCNLNQSVGDASYLKWGKSERLIKDTSALTHGQTGTCTGNDGKVYATICIDAQEWLSEDLKETKYRDGSIITEVQDNSTWVGLTSGARCYYVIP